MKLSKERRNEIAFLFLMNKVQNDNVRLSPNDVLRRIVNTAKDIGISKQEAAAFFAEVLEDRFSELLKVLNQVSEQGES